MTAKLNGVTSLFLPYPPTTNKLYGNREGGRKKSDAYKLWLADAEEAYLQQLNRITKLKGKVTLVLMLKAPDNRKRDISNTIKAVEDFLVSHQIIEADDQTCVRSVTAIWKDNLDIGCFVTIYQLGGNT